MEETEQTVVAIDVGTSKVVALIGEVAADGSVNIIGKGTRAAQGIKKGVVVNIEQTVQSISEAVDAAERTSGYELRGAYVGVGGSHVESLNSPGTVAVSGHHREVTREDIERVTEIARAVNIPSNREILHVVPRGYTVDGQEGVKDPLGMSAVRLEVVTHIVTASATALQNLAKCVQQAKIGIDDWVADPLAAAEAVLSETEMDLGVVVADIGAGTIDMAVFHEGSPLHTAVLPVGGNNVTNDVAIGLKTSLAEAEDLKIRYGTCDLRTVAPEELITVEVIGEQTGRTIQRAEMCSIIEARMREVYELIGDEVGRAGHEGILPAGLVITGGAAKLAGAAELGRQVLDMPVRVAAPSSVGGLTDGLLSPVYSTSIGLLMWGARAMTVQQPTRYESAPAYGLVGRMREVLRGLFP
jgi:cell division protein FtsA